MRKKKQELERKVQTLHTFSPPHTWPITVITVQNVCGYQIVGFNEGYKNCQMQPSNCDGKVLGEVLSDALTRSSVEAC